MSESFIRTIPYIDPAVEYMIPGIELMDDIVLNGQVYNKSTGLPVPFAHYITKMTNMTAGSAAEVASSKNEFFASSMLFFKDIGADTDCGVLRNNLFMDCQNPDICYYIKQAPRAAFSLTSTLQVIIKTAAEYVTTAEIPLIMQGNTSVHYVDQSNEYIYFFRNAITPAMQRYNKNTKEITAINFPTGNILNTKVISKDDRTIYLISWSNDVNYAVTLHKYNKAANTVTRIDTLKAAQLDNYAVAYPIPKYTDAHNGVIYSAWGQLDGGVTKLYMRQYTLNPVTEKIETSLLNMNVPVDYSEVFNHATCITSITVDTDIITEQDKTYFVVSFYNANNKNATTNVSMQWCKTCTFELIDMNTIKFLNSQYLPTWYAGKLNINDRSWVFASNDGIDVYVWSTVHKQVRKTASVLCNPYHIAIDKLNNIYIPEKNKSGAIYKIDRASPIGEIITTFMDKNLASDGNEIASKLKIDATNYLGEYLNTTLELKLCGNVKFTNNGESRIIVNVTSEGPHYEDITIFGPGECHAVATPLLK